MGFFDFIAALFFGLLGLGLLIFLVRALLRPLKGFFRFNRSKRQLKTARKYSEQADKAVEADNLIGAVVELQRAFILHPSPELNSIQAAREHNQGVLNRLFLISETLEQKTIKIAEAERLLVERSEIQILHAKIGESLKNLVTRRTTAGKPLPEWSKGDYSRRKEEVTRELARNLSDLEDTLDQIFSELKGAGKPESNLTVH